MSYYLMHRGWRDHHLFRDQPYSDGEAWEYLIANANYTQSKYRQANKIYEIPRGDLATSYRSLAEKWKWSTNKAIRFLKLLQCDKMISIKTEHNFVQISVINYDVYQNPSSEDGTQTERARNTDGTAADTETNTNVKKRKKDKEDNKNNTPVFSHPEVLSETCLAFMEVRKKKKAANSEYALGLIYSEIEKLKIQGFSPQALVEQSVRNSWIDIYPVKDKTNATNRTSSENSKPKWVSAADEYIAKHSQPG